MISLELLLSLDQCVIFMHKGSLLHNKAHWNQKPSMHSSAAPRSLNYRLYCDQSRSILIRISKDRISVCRGNLYFLAFPLIPI